MEKAAAWIRRHKAKILDICIVIGAALLAWLFINAPININRMTVADWQDTHISGIGSVTLQKLETSGPYTTMQDIDRIPGIGKAKMMQISHYFTTWDTARSDVWYVGFVIGLLLTFGAGFLRYIFHRKHVEDIKWFKQRLDDKNVKR